MKREKKEAAVEKTVYHTIHANIHTHTRSHMLTHAHTYTLIKRIAHRRAQYYMPLLFYLTRVGYVWQTLFQELLLTYNDFDIVCRVIPY